MIIMDKKELSVKEICELIKVSAKFGVSELKFGNLQFRMVKNDKISKNPVAEITEEEHKKMTQKALESDEIRLKKDQIEQMMIENPSLAEELVMDGDLDDDDESESER